MTYKTIAMASVILIGAVMSTNLHAKQEHPFLICKPSQFDQLRQRASAEPWATMKADAAARIQNKYDPTDPVQLNRYIGACALMYILEADDADDYALKVRDAILQLDQTGFDPSKRWSGTVPQMGAAFVCTLALDIVYDGLSDGDIKACEDMIETCISIIDRKGSWPTARYGTHGTWDIYKGVRTTPDDAFYDYCMIQMTSDGVSSVSPGYAFARMGAGDDRPQKIAYADVLEFTGIDRRYYNNERFKKFYRWLYSCCVTPARQFYLFGDVSPRWGPSASALMWRIGRFDSKAASYAAWLFKDKKPIGHILSYILTTEPLPEPTVPTSKLYMKGAAVFREVPDSADSLGCMLYNITENAEWHTHEEVNGISCAAYGNRLLVNGGWLGEPMRPAQKNNTLAINGQRHQKQIGGGLTEGILGNGLDYACGDSTKAISDDKSFQRSVLLVHTTEAANGYFAVIDEVTAAADDTINIYLHPATQSPIAEVAANNEYLATIDHHAKVDGVSLSVFYATMPDSVEQSFIESGSPERDAKSGKHYRLSAAYPADENGNRQIVSILFPHNSKHAKAKMQSIERPNATGAQINFASGITDYILATTKPGEVKLSNISKDSPLPLSFDAKAAMVRISGDAPMFYFARSGRSLRVGDIGFESSAPISLHMKETAAQKTGPAAEVTFYHPNITQAHIAGQATQTTNSGPGWIKIKIPAGSHKIELF